MIYPHDSCDSVKTKPYIYIKMSKNQKDSLLGVPKKSGSCIQDDRSQDIFYSCIVIYSSVFYQFTFIPAYNHPCDNQSYMSTVDLQRRKRQQEEIASKTKRIGKISSLCLLESVRVRLESSVSRGTIRHHNTWFTCS